MHFDVVFHVDTDAAALGMALTNVANYLDALVHEAFTVVLLVNGPAIGLLTADGEQASLIGDLAAKGLSVRVCRNAMRHFGVPAEQLHPACAIVPAGVVELVDLQRKGFAYIKP
ncbi:MAG: DsrE family protein [Solidesulfovibrio sp.]|uniref:DsrE family protein n=1 Tax=Solidesulfovibrio sp. TaxID=2910990 RepID=UPI002B2091AD|nr:DsrE family protein [Solidesulfovibrio sp.]MEA4857853.1 DsrE family protein [Solidesulfovibrio sp.]